MAPLLIVALISFWLAPSVHFAAMLDVHLYETLNPSMAVDGILFRWLMLAPRRDQGSAPIGYPGRIVIVLLVARLVVLRRMLHEDAAAHAAPAATVPSASPWSP